MQLRKMFYETGFGFGLLIFLLGLYSGCSSSNIPPRAEWLAIYNTMKGNCANQPVLVDFEEFGFECTSVGAGCANSGAADPNYDTQVGGCKQGTFAPVNMIPFEYWASSLRRAR